MSHRLSFLCLFLAAGPVFTANPEEVRALLGREIVGPRQARLDVVEYVRPLVPRLKPAASADEWAKEVERLRRELFDRVVFRGEAAKWRDFKVQVKELDAIAGGPGYRIKKLRYEALPGLWIPALLYEPTQLSGKVPVMLAVNGHDRTGKAADYKQQRCINLAKRGVIVLNVEWVGMGQLSGDGYRHGCMNQLDLCGTSGLAVFYLAMSRGLDVLTAHDHADSARVGVSGLSGGGWQTIYLSALDKRVTLSNPVAGYSSFLTRIEYYKDLGDSEQTPCDMATVADYTHLTAMMAPRPTLLTYNAKDNCCFEAGYALPPLFDGARPYFKLSRREDALRTHVNADPGDHNYGKDNREALYRMVRDHWFAGRKDFDANEIDVRAEVKNAQELTVELPPNNADFNTLARALMKDLPRDASPPSDRAKAEQWQDAKRAELRKTLRLPAPYDVKATMLGGDKKGTVEARYWRLELGREGNAKVWTVPVVELRPAEVKGVTLLIGDAGRRGLHAEAAKLLAAGRRVFAVDPFYNGESSIDQKAFLFALMVATVGDRALGLQVRQLTDIAGWVRGLEGVASLELHSVGPRASVTALAAAGLGARPFDSVTLDNPLASLKEIIEENRSYDTMPEQFCFGLLEHFDVKPLAGLVLPRPLRIVNASESARKQLDGLKEWYRIHGEDHDPIAPR